MPLAAFMPSSGVCATGIRLSDAPGRCRTPVGYSCSQSRRKLRMLSGAPDVPAIGLVPTAGTTGTCAANLWPIPILGAYGWTLFVWKRADMQENFTCVNVHDDSATRLTFSIVPVYAGEQERQTEYREIPGIVTGDYNVASALAQLGATAGKGYRLTFMDRKANSFMSLKTRVTCEDSTPPRVVGQLWSSESLQFRVQSLVGAPPSRRFQVLSVYEGTSKSIAHSKYQFFAMALAPIPVLGPYTCFVAVNKQSKERPFWSALDKVGKSAQLSLVEWTEIPRSGIAESSFLLAKVAAMEFQGSLTDQMATQTHLDLLQAIREAGYCSKSESDYRILMDNRPGVFMARRRNVLLIELSRDQSLARRETKDLSVAEA